MGCVYPHLIVTLRFHGQFRLSKQVPELRHTDPIRTQPVLPLDTDVSKVFCTYGVRGEAHTTCAQRNTLRQVPTGLPCGCRQVISMIQARPEKARLGATTIPSPLPWVFRATRVQAWSRSTPVPPPKWSTGRGMFCASSNFGLAPCSKGRCCTDQKRFEWRQ